MGRKSIKNLIASYFFINPTTKSRVRELERQLKLPLPSIIRYCRELEKEGILATTKIGIVMFYNADRASKRYLLEKKLFNIRSVYECGLVNHLREELSNPPIILFGSYARGEDIEESDIDLYIEMHSKKEVDLLKYEKALTRKIQVFRHKSLADIKNVHLSNNIINGVILNGYIEVFR